MCNQCSLNAYIRINLKNPIFVSCLYISQLISYEYESYFFRDKNYIIFFNTEIFYV